MVEMRDAGIEDGPALTQLVRTSAAYDGQYRAMAAGQTIDAAYTSTNPTRVAQEAGRIGGFYSLSSPRRGDDGEPEPDSVFVDDRRRGSGIGPVLADDLRRQAAALGVQRVHIASHPSAEPSCRALGARPIGAPAPAGRVTWSRPLLVLDVTGT